MDRFPFVPMDVAKWNKITKVLKKQYQELTTKEQSAFEVLNDFWRNGNFDKEECAENIKILADESVKHGNNLPLKTDLQIFRELCTIYYTKEEPLFREFQKVLDGKPIPAIVIPKPVFIPTPPIVEASNHVRKDYNNGDYYIGELMNGSRHGRGKYFYVNGDWEEGEWNNDELHGQGRMHIVSSGRTDEGQYRNGRRFGRGTMTWDDGHRYEGEWDERGAHGYGEFFYPNWGEGATYKGQFVNQNRHGKGIVRWKNGNWYDGQWDNGNMTGQGTNYIAKYKRTDTGEFRDGNRVGYGESKWLQGDRYVGTWDDTSGSLQGQGIYWYANGDREKGKYVNGTWIKTKTFGTWVKSINFMKIWRGFGQTLNVIALIVWIGGTLLTWYSVGFFSALIFGILGFVAYSIFAFILEKLGLIK